MFVSSVRLLIQVLTSIRLKSSDTNPLVARDERQDRLKTSWGFDCSCSTCTLPSFLAHESDRRLAIMDRLTEELNDWTAESKATPEKAEMLISLSKQERLSGFMALPYRLAALAYNAVNDSTMAAKYALLAVEAAFLEDGEHHEDTVATIEMLEGLEEHWSRGMRSKTVEGHA